MKTVLLVDDDNTILLGTGVRLKGMGYTVYTAKDVVVLDISIPAGDGFLVAERLQNPVGSAATPIIFMTASDNPALPERAMKLGAVGFPKKPFDATSLADTIESALSPGDNWRPSVAVYRPPRSTPAQPHQVHRGTADSLTGISTGASGRPRSVGVCKFKRNSAFCGEALEEADLKFARDAERVAGAETQPANLPRAGAGDIDELCLLLERQNLAAVDRFELLSSSLSEPVGAVRFDRLREAINNLDFQLGAELLRQAVLPKETAAAGARG
jgi:ActR/RegA family two-component response regulator